eukprot:COSAG06_NODE_544_length_14458_cov_18.391671_14_plen_155_part_00
MFLACLACTDVAKDQRGRGLGLLLLRHALLWASARYDTLILSVWRQLATARALYRAHGFVTREQVYSPVRTSACHCQPFVSIEQLRQGHARFESRCLLSPCMFVSCCYAALHDPRTQADPEADDVMVCPLPWTDGGKLTTAAGGGGGSGGGASL